MLPHSNFKLSLIASSIPAIISCSIVSFSIEKFAEYGYGIFILAPFFIGLVSSILKGYHGPTTLLKSFGVTLSGLFIFCVLLIICAIEGLACIIMSAPVGLFSAFIGCLIGYFIQKNKFKNTIPIVIGLQILFLPSFIAVESKFEKTPTIFKVTTSLVVDAPKQVVWNNLISFKKIDAPLDFIFRNGISYPIDSEVKGKGTKAIRYCNFSTGSFVEPVDVWNEPNHLHFYVEEQPIPMKETSPYEIHPKHLHGYFVSTEGQFRLTEMANGQTKLEGTTWYYNKIYPEIYWSWWTDYIIHKIHSRVLTHIKKESELN